MAWQSWRGLVADRSSVRPRIQSVLPRIHVRALTKVGAALSFRARHPWDTGVSLCVHQMNGLQHRLAVE
jgi:hypothetical protein